MKLSNVQNDLDCFNWDISELRTTMTIPFLYAVCTFIPYVNHIYATADSVFGSLPRKAALPSQPQHSYMIFDRANMLTANFTSSRINDAECQKAFGFDSITSGIEYQRTLSVGGRNNFANHPWIGKLRLDQQSLENSTHIFFTG